VLAIWFGLFLITCACVCGCDSNGPKVSGLGLLNSRNFFVDDIVDIEIPYDPALGVEWRLTSYDSLMLQLVERPRVVPGKREGEFFAVTRFRARTPGEVEVVFERTRPEARKDNDKKFKITIFER
jgi:hypothetical protein